mmetsp:Transcript_41318/g.125029  ORF Transcript_41318/g.125029 Transcript_41318/m.125029 type:complete len:406 (-) Transcript_41318:1143-2360(-)
MFAGLCYKSELEAPVPTKAPGTHPVDLLLPKRKKPTDLKRLSYYRSPRTVKNLFGGAHGKTYAIGSSAPDQKIYHERDLGLFECVYEAWKNHYNLRTTSEDWWFPVACKIAKAIDKAAKGEDSSAKKVRELFVNHEGKEKLCVDVDVFTIYEVDYDQFFSEMSSEITRRIKIPKYAEAMQNDFSTSSTTHRIGSQINLMASMQQFFSFEMGLCGCGIKGLEMLGEQKDWDALAEKLRLVKKQLEPIHDCLRWELPEEWWSHVERVFIRLAETYAASNSKQTAKVADFWADIFLVGKGWKHGPSGIGGHAAEEYNGWLVRFLTGRKTILKEEFFEESNVEKLKGLNSVPMTITMKYLKPPIQDEAELSAGILGFEIHEKDTFNGVPSFQPYHAWALKLAPNSKIRG